MRAARKHYLVFDELSEDRQVRAKAHPWRACTGYEGGLAAAQANTPEQATPPFGKINQH